MGAFVAGFTCSASSVGIDANGFLPTTADVLEINYYMYIDMGFGLRWGWVGFGVGVGAGSGLGWGLGWA